MDLPFNMSLVECWFWTLLIIAASFALSRILEKLLR